MQCQLPSSFQISCVEVLWGKGNELDRNQTPPTDTRKRMFYQIISPCKGPGSLTFFFAAKSIAALTK